MTLVLLGLIGLSNGIAQLYANARLDSHGRLVYADVPYAQHGKPSTVWLPAPVDREVPLRHGTVSSTVGGGRVLVRYDPGDPSYAEPADGAWRDLALIELIAGFGAVVLSWFAYRWYRYELARPYRPDAPFVATVRSDLPEPEPPPVPWWGHGLGR